MSMIVGFVFCFVGIISFYLYLGFINKVFLIVIVFVILLVCLIILFGVNCWFVSEGGFFVIGLG